MKKLLLFFLLAVASVPAFAQEPTQMGAVACGLNSLTVTATPDPIIVGGTSTLTAQALDCNNQPNIFLTNQCVWTSSNPAIFTVSGNVATGVSAGNANAVCTVQTPSGPNQGAAQIIVSGAPLITNPPADCIAPCVLPPGTQSVAYSPTFQFTCSTPNPPCTWTNSVGTPPTGMSLSSSGVLSGTPSGIGTTTWTVQACDTVPNCTTLQVTITINAASSCGPPTYPCSTTTTNNPGVITAPFTSGIPSGTVTTSTTPTGSCSPSGGQVCMTKVSGTAFDTSWPTGTVALSINGAARVSVAAWNSSTVATVNTTAIFSSAVSYAFYGACTAGSANGTGNGCVNSTGYDLTLNPTGTDCISRIVDGSTGAGQSVDNLSHSGGDNDVMGSVNEDYLGVSIAGANHILYGHPDGNGCWIVANPGDNTASKGIHPGGGFGFSRAVNPRFYYLKTSTELHQADISAGTVNTSGTTVTFVSNNSSAPPLTSWTGTIAINYVTYTIASCASAPTSCTLTTSAGTQSGKPYSKNDTFVDTKLVDLFAAGVCPGVTPFTANSASVLGVSSGDTRFSWAVGPGGQGSADWLFAWDRTLGCSSVNFATGQAWAFCTASCSSSTQSLGVFQGNVNTTGTTAVTSTGQQAVQVASAANMFVGQVLCIDSGNSTCTGANQEFLTITNINLLCQPNRCISGNFAKTHASGYAITYTASTCFGSNGAAGAGLHESPMTVDGNYVAAVITGSNGAWTGGGCAGSTIGSQESWWKPGTLNDVWTYNAPTVGVGGAQYGNHPSLGVTHTISGYYAGPNIRSTSALTAFTQFAPALVANDFHGTWVHPTGDDSYPWIVATDLQLAAQGSGCTFPALCPLNGINTIQAWFPNATYPPGQTPVQFTHTFSCNLTNSIYAKCPSGVGDGQFGSQDSIGVATQKGNYFCWASTMLQGLGNDVTGAPRTDAFCVHLQ